MSATTIDLTDAEKRDLVSLIQAGKPLPEKYRFVLFDARSRQTKGWTNKLILSSLKSGPLREQIEEAGERGLTP